MSEEVLAKEAKGDIQWYEDDISIRGCQISLPQIKAAYRELALLTKKEGERIVGSFKRPDGLSEEDFQNRNKFLKDDAFRVTVSIIGFDGQTAYGETEEIFDLKNLPVPIKRIYFTNTTSYKRNANNNEPTNHFSVWLNFDKPPLFDPNPLVSEPTLNFSKVDLRADDVGYFRAVQSIIARKIRSDTKWYSFIHEKFAYDAGLWLIALPYALYWTTVFNDRFLPLDGEHSSFRVAGYIYGLGVSLLIYRALFSYIKWAFPVNILEENKDRATGHRLVLGAILLSLVVSSIVSLFGMLSGLG